MSQDRSNLKAGVFVVAGIVLAFISIVALSNFESMFTQMQTVHVRYALGDGLMGLKEGAVVTIGHHPAGSVTDIEDIEDADGRVVAKRVVFEIPARYKLYDNAMIEVDAPAVGSGTKLNIKNVGTDHGDAPTDGDGHDRLGDSWRWEPGDDAIPGGIATSPLMKDFVHELGIREQQRKEIQQIIYGVKEAIRPEGDEDRLPRIVGNIDRVVQAVADDPEKIRLIVDDAQQAMADVREIIADLKVRRAGWWEKVDRVLAIIESASGEADAILKENRPALREAVARGESTLTNADAVVKRVREQTMPKIEGLLTKADAAMDDVQASVRELRGLAVTRRPDVERMIGNLRLASDQLKLAVIEVRRAPWRLLYSPSDEELETDNLYDAARSFALAASSLDGTADSLRALVDRHGERLDASDTNLQVMLDNLRLTFEQFKDAETEFWDALRERPSGAGAE